jgi:hypothetical protein
MLTIKIARLAGAETLDQAYNDWNLPTYRIMA